VNEPSAVLAISAAVALSVVVAVVLTILHLFSFADDCTAAGGTFSNEGTTAWCRH
jgi:hypothetical protein